MPTHSGSGWGDSSPQLTERSIISPHLDVSFSCRWEVTDSKRLLRRWGGGGVGGGRWVGRGGRTWEMVGRWLGSYVGWGVAYVGA